MMGRGMGKKEEMEWRRKGGDYLLERGRGVLNKEVEDKFVWWYGGFESEGKGGGMGG